MIVDANAGNSRFFGAETQIDYQATPHDLLNFQIAWEHATYGNFAIPIASNAPPGASDGAATSFDLSGQTEAHVPEWNGSFSYQHTWDIGPGTLTAQGHIRWQTWSYTTIQEWYANGNTIQGGYHMSDLQLRYAADHDKWAVWGWVSNLENKTVINYVYPLYKESLDAPRMYGVNVSYKY